MSNYYPDSSPEAVSAIFHRGNPMPHLLISKTSSDPDWQRRFPTLYDRNAWLEGNGYRATEFDNWPTAWEKVSIPRTKVTGL